MYTDRIPYRRPVGLASCPGNELVLGLINGFRLKMEFTQYVATGLAIGTVPAELRSIGPGVGMDR